MRISDWSSDVCSSDLQQYQPKIFVRGKLKGQFGQCGCRADEHDRSEQAAYARADQAAAKSQFGLAHFGQLISLVGVGGRGRSAGDTQQATRDVTRENGHGCGCDHRSEEHTSELQSLMRISYAVFCLKKQHK